MKKTIKNITLIVAGVFFINSCEDNIDKENLPIPYASIGGYQNSDEIASDHLISKISFDNSSTIDSKSGLTGGNVSGSTFNVGVKGMAYKGSTNGFISYSDVNDKIKNLKSVTQSMWIKTSTHTGGAQCLFMLPKTTDFWGNIFVLIESSTDGKMLMKFHIQKDVTPNIPWAGQFIETGGTNKLDNMYDKWKHVVWTYDGGMSLFSLYVDGVKIQLPDSITKRYSNDPSLGGGPLGDLANSNVSKFIVGGYQQHLGTPWGSPDSWMLNYTGLMDEFRMYDKALTAGEIDALYKLEKDNR
ncbi:LamG domain-containing protein [Chryseobacterium taeanense]|uniref:Concanavalin A-like lectin/glucanases superfamily protein n=1 Tax=Chryseobacterium taeanense TaxID=311334 RepID=A0A1G8NDY8_9FLAO|nr:LamG domain-containing protein [Chryseobacterium taeanense]SDI77740.1 Concanavalin A-like lectin/glucanases superfamily protein [Chryseobacterium taeanense]